MKQFIILSVVSAWVSHVGLACFGDIENRAKGTNKDPNLNCPDEWFASGKHCYQLSLSETKTIDEAKKMCSQLKPGNENELPTFDDENDWHDMLGFLLYKSQSFKQNEVKFWLDLSAKSGSDKWLWGGRVPLSWSNFVSPPSEIKFDPADKISDSCAIGWAQKSSQKNGWGKIKCGASTDVATICQWNPSENNNKKVSPHSNEGLTVKTVKEKFDNVQLKNGKRLQIHVSQAELEKQNELINKMNQILAKKMGISGSVVRTNSPVRGDKFVTTEDLEADLQDLEGKSPKLHKRSTKSGITRWVPEQSITYAFDKNFGNNGEHHRVFEKAIEFWDKHTCFSFVPSDDPDVVLMDGGGCYSVIGRSNFQRPQPLSLGEGCDTLAIATHEIGHMLGLDHEQSRTDREKYVEVYINSINTSYIDNFRPCCNCGQNRTKRSYDYGSVMHYGPTDFTKNEKEATILPHDPLYWHTIGTSIEPSFLDVKTVNDFNCKNACVGKGTKCENGGYPHPKNCAICLCPTGFGGAKCADYADFEDFKCGHTKDLTEKPHSFSSPNYPTALANVSCVWLFRVPADKRIELKFEPFFDLPVDCSFGHIEIKNELDLTASGKRFCGPTPPPTTITKGNNLVVILRKLNGGKKRHGFGAQVRAIDNEKSYITWTPLDANELGYETGSRVKREVSKSSFNEIILEDNSSHRVCANITGAMRNASAAQFSRIG